MAIPRVAPKTIYELAALSADTSTLYFGVGTADGDELLRLTAASLNDSEALISIEDGAGCLGQVEEPEQTPAIGAWCSKGCLVDYAFDAKGIAELMQDARRKTLRIVKRQPTLHDVLKRRTPPAEPGAAGMCDAISDGSEAAAAQNTG
jgi:hypothetical protein